MTHKSKVDVWIVSAILVAILVLAAGGNHWIAGPVLLVLMLCAWPQSFQTTPAGLLVRAGLVSRFVPYQLISFVGPAGAGAWAGQVAILYGPAGELLLAPADVDAFLADMSAHTPHLVRRGQELVVWPL